MKQETYDAFVDGYFNSKWEKGWNAYGDIQIFDVRIAGRFPFIMIVDTLNVQDDSLFFAMDDDVIYNFKDNVEVSKPRDNMLKFERGDKAEKHDKIAVSGSFGIRADGNKDDIFYSGSMAKAPVQSATPTELITMVPFTSDVAVDISSGLNRNDHKGMWRKEGEGFAYYVWIGKFQRVKITHIGGKASYQSLDKTDYIDTEPHQLTAFKIQMGKGTFTVVKDGKPFEIKAKFL